DGFISIVCDIPKHFGEATDCQLYTGDERQSYLKTKTSKSATGDLFCQFTVNKDDLFRRLQSVRSRGVSCDYTVNTEPPSLSPRSDPYNFTGLSVITRKAHLPSSQPAPAVTAAPPPRPHLKISPAVLRESSTVQMTCEVPQSQSASLCLFYLDGIEAAPYSHPSCQMSLSGVQIQQWTRQSSPLEAKVGCNYLTEGERTQSDHSDYVALTVLDRLQKPNIMVLHDGSISIVCDIPKHFGEATHCQLYTGDERQSYLKTKTSKSATGDLFCQFTVNKDDLFRRLQSVRSRGVSCDYTVNTEPPSLSPRSDPYNFTDEPEMTTSYSQQSVTFGTFCLAHPEAPTSKQTDEKQL
ncbi:hypothetical protein AALO_G00143600, partial [Alosa alosa]